PSLGLHAAACATVGLCPLCIVHAPFLRSHSSQYQNRDLLSVSLSRISSAVNRSSIRTSRGSAGVRSRARLYGTSTAACVCWTLPLLPPALLSYRPLTHRIDLHSSTEKPPIQERRAERGAKFKS
ncbi:hypothetical protein C8F04DRAFT_1397753, partial [Mycena alexandri]